KVQLRPSTRERGHTRLHHTMLRPRVCMVFSQTRHSSVSKALFLTHLPQISRGVVMSNCALFLLRLQVINRAVAGGCRLKSDYCLVSLPRYLTPERTTAQLKFGNLAGLWLFSSVCLEFDRGSRPDLGLTQKQLHRLGEIV